jgi:UDP-2-acetamido-3-amino-2,3-dideoxy-glucuronate N-acetyltransferase
MDKPIFIHPSAIIDEGASVGPGTKVWHFAHLMSGCSIGENCIIGQNVFVDTDVSVGKGVKIQNNVSVYKGVIIGDDVFLGPSMVFTNVINPRSFIERKHELKQTIVRRGVTIGANATILCGIEIGEYAMVGAGAVVTKNVKAFAIVYGNPARKQGWISRGGYKLIFNDKGEAFCPFFNENYVLEKKTVRISK